MADRRRARSSPRPPRDSAVLGCAAASMVAGGLGTDHGVFDLAAVEELTVSA